MAVNSLMGKGKIQRNRTLLNEQKYFKEIKNEWLQFKTHTGIIMRANFF
jgi:hypothetical protein